ncbi:MAG: hypothetical protein D6705_06055 [Deltaproteobacteria bacterium]|nr:MAG: hypothetical protein D6705_06055 [Deltaproteobacteria bacterium]
MRALFRLSVRFPKTVVAIYLLALAVAAAGISRLETESDVFVFLPDGDPDVERFHETGERFGSLRTALVGIETAPGAVAKGPVLEKIDAAVRALRELPFVVRVDAITTVPAIETGPEGAVIAPVVRAIPRTDAEEAALRERILAQDLVVGELVSADLDAALVVVHLAEGTPTRAVVEGVRAAAGGALADLTVHYGGAPFAAEAIYGEARADVRKLAPLAGVFLVAVVLLSFRDPVGVGLTLFAVAFATLAVLGGMGHVGEKYTLLTSTLPIVLLASGTAYPVHVLGRYYLEREAHPPAEALEATSRIVLRPVAVAAWTTIGAFAGFGVMDVAPMRAFGMQVAVGTLLCWIEALTLVPAVLALVPRGPSREQLVPFGSMLVAFWRFAERHRVLVFGGFFVAFAAASLGLPDVRARMDPQAFFREGSEPARAHAFFEERFGGARFVEIAVDGDMTSPVVLRRLAALADRAAGIEHTAQPTSLVEPTVLTMQVLGGGEALPRTRRQAGQVFAFLESDASMAAYVTDDRRHALVYSRIRGDAEPVVAAMEEAVADESGMPLRATTVEDAARRIAARLSRWSDAVDEAEVRAWIERALAQPAKALRAEVMPAAIDRFLASDDAADLSPEEAGAARRAVAAGRSLEDAFRDAGLSEDDALFYAEIAGRAVDEAVARARIDAVLDAATAAVLPLADDRRARRAVRIAVADLVGEPIETEEGSFEGAYVTGEPLLDRALGRSVERNQVRAMLVGLVIVSFLLLFLFRSIVLSLISVLPAACAAAVIGGVMGWYGVEIDLSTAMVGAIVTDTGSDFGMHYLWYLQRQPAEKVMRNVGPVVVVSTILVAGGFFAFALGSSPVLRLFGTLAGSTCIASSLLAMLLVPAVFALFPKQMARYKVPDDGIDV